MSDRFEREIAGIDGPRAVDAGFRTRLERAMLGAGTYDAGAQRWEIDAPRELSPRARTRIEAAMTRPRRRFASPIRLIAAAMATVLVAGATVVVVDRVGRSGGAPKRPFVAGPTPTTTPPTPPTPRPKPNGPSTLRGFRSASDFLAYVRTEGLKQNGPYGIQGSTYYGGGFGGPIAGPVPAPAVPGSSAPGGSGSPALAPRAPQTAPYSRTNIQEVGVDEPDIVKTDGRTLAVLTGSVSGGSVLRLYDVTKGARFRDSLAFSEGAAEGLFLAGDRAVVFTRLFQAPREARSATHASNRSWTTVTVVSLADPDELKIVASMQLEGSYIDARMAGGIIRLVLSSQALGPEPVSIGTGKAKELRRAESANARSIRRSIVGDWVPHFVLERGGRATKTGHVHDWSAVSRPPDRAGLGMLTVLTIDPANPAPDNAVSVVGAGEEIYASLGSLYVSSHRWDDVVASRSSRPSSGVVTRIHKFDIRDPKRTAYVASGEVAGFLLNQFSMSEYAGRLRAATTVARFDGGRDSSESFVTILSDTGGRLVRVGRVGNLGKGERIYSVRFVGAMGYVVTFRQIDPLYVLDLRKPNHPRVRGELKVPGFSHYLHPIGETLLLGVGQDATEEGQPRGLQFSLFDVTDPTDPRRIDNHVEGPYGFTALQYDHHGFLYWAPQRLVVAPATVFNASSEDAFVGAIALAIEDDERFGVPERLTHQGRPGPGRSAPNPAIQRAFVIGNRLFTFSQSGLLLTDVRSFEDLAWVPFRS